MHVHAHVHGTVRSEGAPPGAHALGRPKPQHQLLYQAVKNGLRVVSKKGGGHDGRDKMTMSGIKCNAQINHKT